MKAQASAIAALVLLAGCATQSKDLSGQVFFPSAPPGYDGQPCTAPTGYDDIEAGLQVVVKNAAGEIVGSGALQESTATAKTLSEEQQRGLQDPQVAAHLAGRVPITCTFPFEVEGIPKSDFYTVQVGSGDRGSLTFNFDELEQQDWKVVLTLGDAP
jgi:hypothetical protein